METGQKSDTRTAQLRVSVLGGFVLHDRAGNPVPLVNRKGCGLLAYLALSRHKTETRECLAGLLWSDREEQQARASLRQTLKQLRALFDELGFTGFLTDRQNISLRPGTVSTDLHDISDQLETGDVHARLLTADAVPERILYGFESLDPSYSTWLRVARQNWQDRIADRLRICISATDRESAKRAAEALLTIDATDEEAHRCLIRHFADAGNMASALKQYKELWELLDEEYDQEPDDETQLLIADIKSGSFQPKPSRRPADKPPASPATGNSMTRLPKIGIGYFTAGTQQGANDYLVEGFRRELVASLIRFREWVIVEARQPIEFGGNGINIGPSPSNPMDYQIDGSYIEDGNNIRIAITLRNMAENRYIWSENISLSLKNWFHTQIEIVNRISIALNVYLSKERLRRRIGNDNLPFDAYARWLQGQQNTLIWTPENEARAESAFREIISIAPSFAPAYSSLAAVHNSRHFRNPGIRRSPTSVQEALDCSRTSVELDPLDCRNQIALAWSNALAGRFDHAELHFGMSRDLNPNNPITLAPTAHGLSYCGKRAEARELAESAIKLNPTLPAFHWGYVSCIRYFDQDFEGSLAASNRAGESIADLVGWRAAAEAMAGRTSEAEQTAQNFLNIVRERWRSKDPPTDENIMSWFLHCFPIKRSIEYELLKEGVAKAGLPVPKQ